MRNPFPPIKIDKKEDLNPAIQLFGRRFFAGQTVSEYLIEMLLVASSGKKIADTIIPENQIFPDHQLLCDWPEDKHLEYAPKKRLNLKLFSFLGASKLETRHPAHRQQFKHLLSNLQELIVMFESDINNKMEILRTLENLFLGFQGFGGKRTWCAQTFLPISKELISGESIWKETKVEKSIENWGKALKYFSHNQHVFLARGGELLYLQLCNVLSQNQDQITKWCIENKLEITHEEQKLPFLYQELTQSFGKIFDSCPEGFSKLANFIDITIDPKTSQKADQDTEGCLKYINCGWCSAESWRESLLFAVELIHICQAEIDPIQRLELLEIACAIQVLRSICAQSARYDDSIDLQNKYGLFSYLWAISEPEGKDISIKYISRCCVNANQRMIYKAIRHSDLDQLLKEIKEAQGPKYKNPYTGSNGADKMYGHKLFITLAKRIGLIVPKTGKGARFTINEKILRFLVLSVIRPGERITFETFKNLIFLHFGIAVDNKDLTKASLWSDHTQLTSFGSKTDEWLVNMLEASGMLLQLSDSCALVTNPFYGGN